jgi:hypothetical protein
MEKNTITEAVTIEPIIIEETTITKKSDGDIEIKTVKTIESVEIQKKEEVTENFDREIAQNRARIDNMILGKENNLKQVTFFDKKIALLEAKEEKLLLNKTQAEALVV